MNGVDGVAHLLGSSSSYAVASTYTPWTFFQVGNIVNVGSAGTAFFLIFTAVIAVACIMIIAGAISMIAGKRKTVRLMSAGLIVLAIAATAFTVFYLLKSGSSVFAGTPTFPILCAISSLVAAIVGFTAKKAE